MQSIVPRLGAAAALVLAVLGTASPGSAVGPPVPHQGLVLHYAMETMPQGRVPDGSGNALNGVAQATSGSATLVTGLQGYGKALALTGSDHQWVAVPSSPKLDVNTYTLSAWVRYTGVPNDKTFDRWEVLEKADAYWMNVRTNGKVRVGGFYGGCSGPNVWQFLDSSTALPKFTWKNVVSTYDGTWQRVYVDGKAVGSKRVSGKTCVSGQPLAVGAKNQPSKGILEAFWDGRLDDVRIYNRALSASEVKQLAARP
jgi:hypothetical protein